MPYKDREKRLEYYKKYHKENSDKITITVHKGKKEEYTKYVEAHDLTLNGFIIYCIEKEMEANP